MASHVASGKGKKSVGGAVDPTVAAIERIREEREARRMSADRYNRDRKAEERKNIKAGKPGDVDFQRLINHYRVDNKGKARKHVPPGHMKVCVAVRKRPINERERAMRDYDAVTAMNPRVAVHSCKLKVDGITKYLENQLFEFDHTFGEDDDTSSVYHYTVQPLVALMFSRGGRGTCFAYGQTGSGKTHTMTGIQNYVARDIFRLASSAEHAPKALSVQVTMFEIYGGRCSDLLHDRSKITIREDGAGKVQTVGLRPVLCETDADLTSTIDRGNMERTTHATAVNEVSSRSHAICEIMTTDSRGVVIGSLTLIDLAGSERAADRSSHNRQRRLESAEINKSLLGLKECIRAMDGTGGSGSYVPFRASKLTLVLKENFTARNSRIVMIAAVSPTASSADHTQNTLRYADRVKLKPAGRGAAGGGSGAYAGLGGPIETDLAFLQKPGGRSTRSTRSGAAPAAAAAAAAAASLGAPSGASGAGYRRDGGAREARDGSGASRVRTSPVTVEGTDGEEDDVVEAKAAPDSRRGIGARVAGRRGGLVPRGQVTPRGDGPVGASGGAGFGARGGAVADADAVPPARVHLDRPRARVARGYDAGGLAPGGRATAEDGKEGDEHDANADADDDDDGLEVELESGGVAVLSPEARDGAVPRRHDPARGGGFASAADVGGHEEAAYFDDDDGGVASEFRPVVARAAAGSGSGSAVAASAAGEERSGKHEDLARLARTLQRDDELAGEPGGAEGKGERWLQFHEVMERIVTEEEEVLSLHMKTIQENAHMLTEEGQLLSMVQGSDIVDYDIDSYASRLDQLLRRKLETTQLLLKRLNTFRQHLRIEDEMSRMGLVPADE